MVGANDGLSPLIFVVEDDYIYRRMLEYMLRLDPENESVFFDTGKSCIAELHRKPDILILDYSLPDLNGKEILQIVLQKSPSTTVIVLSGQTDIAIALEMLKLGAYDYIVKDENTKDRILPTLQNIKKNLNLKREVEDLKKALGQQYQSHNLLIGNSPPMQKVSELITKATQTELNVSITGETGTGKEVVARAIHFNSKRNNKPFVAVNLAAIPKDLLESELFGHEKGAFTGAIAKRKGKFELAEKGTLFLDEIGEMELSLQAKILRVLQEREFNRVGGESTLKLEARIIVATNRDLKVEVSKGNFRQDLYYRIMGFPIHLPPLRERGNDVIILAEHFIRQFCEQNGLKEKKLTTQAVNRLIKAEFPGNVRELKAVIELACVLSNNHEIDIEDISLNHFATTEDFWAQEKTLKEYNQMIIRQYMKKYENDIAQVAEKLDIGKSTLYRYIKEDETLRHLQ